MSILINPALAFAARMLLPPTEAEKRRILAEMGEEILLSIREVLPSEPLERLEDSTREHTIQRSLIVHVRQAYDAWRNCVRDGVDEEGARREFTAWFRTPMAIGKDGHEARLGMASAMVKSFPHSAEVAECRDLVVAYLVGDLRESAVDTRHFELAESDI